MFNLVGGQFLYPGTSNPIAGGSLQLVLSAAATIISTGGPAPASYAFTLDSNGVLTGIPAVWGNNELTPAGTTYTATVLVGGVTVWGPFTWVVGPAALYAGTLYPDVVTVPTAGGSGTGAVSSVFGRTGVVVANTGDYSFSQIGGTVAASQLPNPSASTLGGIESIAFVSHQWVQYIDTSGVPHLAQPAFTDISGTLANAQLPTSGVVAGSYINASITVNAQGIVTAASSGGGGFMTNPMTTLGDMIYETTPGSPPVSTPTRLPGNTTLVKQFLTQTGTGTVSATPAWGAIATADLTAAGSDKQIQFNDGGAFGASVYLTYDKSINQFKVTAPNNIVAPVLLGTFTGGVSSLQGLQVAQQFNGAGVVSGGLFTPLYLNMSFPGTGTLDLALGEKILVTQAASTTTVTRLEGLHVELSVGGTNTTSYGINVLFAGTPTATTLYGLRIQPVTAATPGSQTLWGVYVDNVPSFFGATNTSSQPGDALSAQWIDSGAGAILPGEALDVSAVHAAAGTLSLLEAGSFQIQTQAGAGAVTDARAIEVIQPVYGTGPTPTNYVGLLIGDNTDTVASPPVAGTNNWGIKIAKQTTSTNSYALEVVGGKVKLTPAVKTDIALDIQPATGQTAVLLNVNGDAIVRSLSAVVVYADRYTGVDWGAKVQAAHDALPTTGGTIDATNFPTFVQNAASTINISKPIILLTGHNYIQFSGAPGVSNNNFFYWRAKGTSYVLNANAVGGNSSGITGTAAGSGVQSYIDGLTFDGQSQTFTGAFLYTIKGVITNCIFGGWKDEAIHNHQDLTLRGCIFSGGGGPTILVDVAGVVTTRIESCTVDTGTGQRFLSLLNGTHQMFIDNTNINSGQEGIYKDANNAGLTLYMTNTSITADPGYSSIRLLGNGGFHISNCNLTNVSGADNVVISGDAPYAQLVNNSISVPSRATSPPAQYAGVLLNGTYTCNGINVSHNYITWDQAGLATADTYGIHLKSGAVDFVNNVIAHNVFRGANTVYDVGIYADNSSLNNSYHGNMIIGNSFIDTNRSLLRNQPINVGDYYNDNVHQAGTAWPAPVAGGNADTIIHPGGMTFAQLTTLGACADSSLTYVTDGTAGNPVTGSGSGVMAVRSRGAWVSMDFIAASQVAAPGSDLGIIYNADGVMATDTAFTFDDINKFLIINGLSGAAAVGVIQATATATSGGAANALYGQYLTSGSGAIIGGSGVQAIATHQGTGTLVSMSALNTQVQTSTGAGAITEADSILISAPSYKVSPTNYAALRISNNTDVTQSPPKAATNSWGILIDAQTTSTNSFAIEVKGGKVQLKPNADADVLLRLLKHSATQSAVALELDGTMQFDGITSGSAQLGVAAAASNPNKIQLPTATGAANAVLQTDGNNPQQTSWNAPTGTGANVLAVSPALTGSPTAPTASGYDNSTKIATTAYVDQELALSPATVWFRDDFLWATGIFGVSGANPQDVVSSSPASSGAVLTAARIINGDHAWEVIAIASGTGSSANAGTSTFANPGILTLTSGSTSGNGVALFTGGSSNNGSASFGALGSNSGWEAHFIFNSTTTTTIAVRAGFMNQPTTDGSQDGIWCEFDTANTGNSDSFYTLVTSKATVKSYQASAVAPVASTFVHIKLFSTSAGTVQMSVNGGAPVSLNTNVPTSAQVLCLQILTRGASPPAGAVMNIDFISYMASTGRT